jgi:hypothetical protein
MREPPEHMKMYQFTPVSGYFAVFENVETEEMWEDPIVGMCIVENCVSFQSLSVDGLIESCTDFDNNNVNVTIVFEGGTSGWERSLKTADCAGKPDYKAIAQRAWRYHGYLGQEGKKRTAADES